jgi:hypothetical protein
LEHRLVMTQCLFRSNRLVPSQLRWLESICCFGKTEFFRKASILPYHYFVSERPYWSRWLLIVSSLRAPWREGQQRWARNQSSPWHQTPIPSSYAFGLSSGSGSVYSSFPDIQFFPLIFVGGLMATRIFRMWGPSFSDLLRQHSNY